MTVHRANLTSYRRPDETGTEFIFACLCGGWRQTVFIPDRVEVYHQYVVQPAVTAVFEAGMAFERHVQGIEDED